MKYILFLDDMEVRHEAFMRQMIGLDVHVTQCYTAQGAIKALKETIYDIVCLDHDLNEQHYSKDAQDNPALYENTGQDVAKFIGSEQDAFYHPRNVIIHSWNSIGARTMGEMMKVRAYETHMNLKSVPFEVGATSIFASVVRELVLKE